ncbi:MAG: hypothetical protein LBT03_00830 [Holosporales bacterium]|jgi:hypothetical protein|nr:hypothetical protein [Holosporales bacterium]
MKSCKLVVAGIIAVGVTSQVMAVSTQTQENCQCEKKYSWIVGLQGGISKTRYNTTCYVDHYNRTRGALEISHNASILHKEYSPEFGIFVAAERYVSEIFGWRGELYVCVKPGKKSMRIPERNISDEDAEKDGTGTPIKYAEDGELAKVAIRHKFAAEIATGPQWLLNSTVMFGLLFGVKIVKSEVSFQSEAVEGYKAQKRGSVGVQPLLGLRVAFEKNRWEVAVSLRQYFRCNLKMPKEMVRYEVNHNTSPSVKNGAVGMVKRFKTFSTSLLLSIGRKF